MLKLPMKNRTIYTSLYSSTDYVLCIANIKISPVLDDRTEIPPGKIVFRKTNGEEVRYIREEQ